MASEGSPDPSAATLPAAASAAPTASDSLASAESYLSPLPRHELRVESTLDSLTDPPKTSHIRYRYTKEQMYAIAASKAAQIKPPRLPSIVCRDEPGNLADHREIERERARERRADKLGPPPGLAPPTEKRGRDRTKAKAAADATSSWKDRPEGAPASADGGSKQFPSSQLGKANPIGDGTKAKPAARTADGRAAGRAERGAAKREDPRLRNRKDRETFGFDVSSPLEPATLEGLSAASARDPEEVRRFAAVSNESFDAAPEPFALAADGAPDAVLLSDMLLMERKLATTAAEPSAAAGEDSRFGRWFEARESPPVRASSLLAAVAPTPPPTEPAAKPHVDAAVVSFSAASVTSVYAAAPPSSASVSVPASAPSAPVSSASDQRTQRAAPVAAPSQPTAAPSLPPSSSSSAPASAAPSVAPTTAPAPAPAAQHASHSAPTNSNSGFPAPSHSHEHHAPPPHASHYEPSSPSSFPLPQMPRPPTADGSSFPLPQLSAMPPSTFTSNALLSLLRQGEQQRGPAPPMAKGGAAPPPQKSGEAPMAYHPSYGMHPSHMQMMPPPYAAQPPPMHAGQMQSAPPHLGHPHSHLGPRPPTHTPLPPPAGYAPPNYPPASKGAAAGAPPPGMMKAPAPYMAPPYANAPPPGKMPPGYGPEAGYYYGPPQQAAPQQGGPRQPFPQGPPQPHGAPPPAGAGLERWFGQMAVAAPPRPTGPVQMKSLDEIESQLSRQQ